MPILSPYLRPILDASLRSVFGSFGSSGPLALFGSGEAGVWYDPSDFSTLFQDSAGTIPVTAVEQPVGKMLDKSGRGNHATQATSASRPVLSSRVNLLTKSEQFNLAPWSKLATGVASVPVVTADYALAPDGTMTADRLQFALNGGTTVGDVSYINQTITSIPNGVGAWWIKTADGTTKNVTFRVGAVTSIVSITPTWQRFQLATTNVTLTDILLYGNNGVDSVDLLVWGAQVENGSVASKYQRIDTATSYDTAGFPLYLAADGVDDYMDTGATIAFGVNYFTSWAGAVTGGGTYPGLFRVLRSGGSATATTDNLLEEYAVLASPTLKSVAQRYPSLASMSSAVACRPGFGPAQVSWNNNGGTGASRQGVIFPASAYQDLAASSPALTAGSAATLSLFRGYSGNFLAGRMYGFVYVASRYVTDAERDNTNNYLLTKAGTTR